MALALMPQMALAASVSELAPILPGPVDPQPTYPAPYLKEGDIFNYHVAYGEVSAIWHSLEATGSIVIPETVDGYPVTSLSTSTVGNRPGPTSISIPAGVREIEEEFFRYFPDLVAVTVDEDNEYFCSENGVLYNKDKTVLILCPAAKEGTFTIPASVTEIADEAFCGGKISAVVFHQNLEVIGDGAFNGCDALEELNLLQGLRKIGKNVFANCSKLAQVLIPATVESIGKGPFANCTKLEAIKLADGISGYCAVDGVLFDAEKKTLIQYPVGKGDDSYEVPAGVKAIGDMAFWGANDLENVQFPAGLDSIGKEAFNCCENLSAAIVPDGTTQIGDRAFWYCLSMDEITFPDSITQIGTDVIFSTKYWSNNENWEAGVLYVDHQLMCSDGTGVFETYEVKEGTITIADYAFVGSTYMSAIVIPDSVVTIGEAALSRCDSLESVVIGDGVKTIGDEAFYWSSMLRTITFGEQVESIGSSAFEECSSLKEVVLPDSLITLGERAFDSCAALKSVVIGDGLLEIEDDTFYNCTALEEVIIGESVKIIGEDAFWECSALAEIIIPDSVEKIGDYAFSSCTALETAVIGDGVKELGEYVFEECVSLENLVLGANIEKIGRSTFANCESLVSVAVPEKVTELTPCLFYGCTSLTTLVLPVGLTKIDYFVCENCNNLTDVWYGGTLAQKNQMDINRDNYELNQATWHYMFNDLPASHWAYDSIFYCYQNGIMSGTGDGSTFNPSGTMTRAALVSMLYRLAGSPTISGNAGFSDVAEGAWYADAVIWASQNGIVSGKGDGRFAPTDPVTRASFVSILYRYAEHEGWNTDARADLSTFADAGSVPAWARESIEWAVAEGLLSGTTSGGAVYVNPNGKATRAQGAVLLQKFCEM